MTNRLRFKIGQYKLIIISSIVMSILFGKSFFIELTHVFSGAENYPFIISCYLSVLTFQIFFISLLANRWLTKAILIVFFISGSLSNYFINNYGITIDTDMIANIIETDKNEALGLVNSNLLIQLLAFGILPSLLICLAQINHNGWLSGALQKLKTVGICFGLIFLLIWADTKTYTSFFREYRYIRHYVLPLYPIYSLLLYTKNTLSSNKSQEIKTIDNNASIIEEKYDENERELIIMVVGETARADHFGINGYPKNTTPYLSQIDNITSYTQVTSCGTSTSISVPCMFSHKKRDEFSKDDIYSYENALDILSRTGVNILWRDNNSSSKGVAERIDYENFKNPENNALCDDECRDEGMLIGLDDYISQHPNGDILIILHQMGSHGPEYYKRYPASFEHFTPVCKSNQLNLCSSEEIINAYDNSILYTDYFLNKTIDFVSYS